jgi:hypothetical protein
MERVRFIEHEGKQVLLLDFTECTPDDVFDMMSETQRIVTAQPPQSVLTLSDLSGGQFTREAVRRMKEVAALDRPHVKRAAMVGVESLPKVFYKGIMEFSARNFPAFNTRKEALAWLVKEEDQHATPAA